MMLEIKNASKSFAGFKAINDVSLHVGKGALHAVIGPNGAGKSTLFNIVSGLVTPDIGSVVFDGMPLQHMRIHEIVRVGIARSFQRVNIFPRKTVFDNVQIALIARSGLNFNPFRKAHGLFREETRELLKLVRLDGEEDRLAGHLAHGRQKQVELAVALAARPKMLLLDEPTAGMSIAETKASIDLIRDVVLERQLTLLFTEHDMNVVFGMATAVSVLHHGEIIVTGEPAAVRANEDVRRIYLGTQ